MSYINFESGRVKDELRNEKRKAREAVLEKAEADYKRRKEREKRAAERGEDKWMLPSLDAQLQPDSKKKKKKEKKEKKEKKKKKEKKHKHKDNKKDESSDSSNSSESVDWVEKGSETISAGSSAPTQRDEWMTLPALFPCINREQLRAQKRQEPTPQDEEAMRKKFLLDNPGQSERELNPYWKDGGKGLPQVDEPQPESLSLPANTAGDHGLAWLRRALRRVQEQAKEQGRSEEAVAAERWGSLEKLKSMLSDAERRCRMAPRSRSRGGKMQGPKPRPREYEDWREDPTAGESAAAQSEVVGDKSRYRAWLGLKAPSPPREPSPIESDDEGDRDDGPVVDDTGMTLKDLGVKDEKSEPKKSSEDSDSNDEKEDSKILFRSVNIRKGSASGSSSSRTKLLASGRASLLHKKLPLMSIGEKDKEIPSDDEDDKLFEEWRNEKKNDSSDSDNEGINPKKLDTSKGNKRNIIQKLGVEKKEGNDSNKVATSSENCPGSSKKNSERNVIEGRKESHREMKKENEDRYPSKYIDDQRRELHKDHVSSKELENMERRKVRDTEMKGKRDRKDESEDKEYRYKSNQSYEDEGNRRDRSRERGSPHREKRRDYEENKTKQKYEYDKSKSWRKDRYAESTDRIHGQERERHRESRHCSKDNEDEKSESRDFSGRGSNRDYQAGPRRTEIPEYLRKRNTSPSTYDKAPPRRLEGFRKPDENVGDLSRSTRHDILGDFVSSRGSSGSKNWMKKELRKPEEKLAKKEETEVPRLDPKPAITIPRIKETEIHVLKEEEKHADVEMSDAEMNALGAKVLKAEILGNHTLAAKLKAQLSRAQNARQQRQQVPAKQVNVSANKPQEEETIILTHRDSKGFFRPLAAPTHPEPSEGRRRPQRVATHGADGLRERFFPDDDKYTLENMFQKEKMTTIEDTNEEFARLAAKGAGRTDSEYDLDDIFAEKASREKAPGKLQALERNRAIREHKRVERSLDSCTHCFDSPRMLKHLMIALGSKVYLSLPPHQSLTEGHCLLSPIHHVPCATQLDEDVWEEMSSFRKALVAMFSKKDEDCVFFESSMHLKRFPHMVLECVPLPREVGDTAPIYFKKAIMESEVEWSMNKKLVDLKGKGVRRAVPKGLPYFAVDFGLEDGFAHVIEDEKLFPENFAQEIIGGMLDLDHTLWRKQRRENFDTQRKKVLQFAEMWKGFDITKKDAAASSSSSSDSENENG